MATTYNGHAFKESGSAGANVPSWPKKWLTITKIIPGGTPVVQSIGADVPRLVMPIQGTASQMSAIEGDMDGSTHSLVIASGTYTALLEELSPRIEVKPGTDLYQRTATFLK
jgi:hypothetical protein